MAFQETQQVYVKIQASIHTGGCLLHDLQIECYQQSPGE